ncbi:MAG: OsmC family protein [Anaerolineae bacterium]|nr:OsmC family protein [Anaerolineae bacterium]MCO5195336.1 OsmC family protein [Anaerolineae bacterium]MCO5197328.1 OsmC family protein [Anaerolineae bacterium]
MGIVVTVKQQSLTTAKGSIRGHNVLIDRPLAKGGTDMGMMGGEMLLAALGGCFMSNLLELVRTRDAAITDITATIDGTLAQSPNRFSAVDMVISAETDDTALFEKFVLMAERACIVANTLKNGTALTIRTLT